MRNRYVQAPYLSPGFSDLKQRSITEKKNNET
ncbi:MAG: hypothetical protein C5S48_09840 [Candidatus Methanogaster sp.]|nr:MAG: hypothetical protein C5S48_09840 [ANME-2 cluster archaeon]